MYVPAEDRYENAEYRRVGRSGLVLPPLSLGLWHNFGDDFALENQREIIHMAFDHGITHFDLANNYGPPAGSAEINFGRILREDFAGLRDELIISTKAGWGHVARALWRTDRQPQAPARQPGSVAEPDGAGPRGHLLLPPS